jgi:beta-glucosidase
MAPGVQDPASAGTVIHHLGLAHGRAVQAFRASRRGGSIGPCFTLSPCYPATDSEAAREFARVGDLWANGLYIDPVLDGRYPVLPEDVQPRVMAAVRDAVRDGDLEVISAPVDFLGVNYYSPTIFDDQGKMIALYPTSAAGWQQIYPEGLYDVLLRLHRRYGMELMITENGIPDIDADTGTVDGERIEFLRASLLALHRALEDGARVSGYYAWSLLDNFEWARGYTQRWGIVHVDYGTQRRTPKDSARWFSDVVRQRALPAR